MNIVILGGGISGLSLAIYAKKKGLNPILLTKGLPKTNYGETVHPGFKAIFDMVIEDVDIDQNYYRTSGIIIKNSEQEQIQKYSEEYDWKGYQLERPQFDNFLISYAKKKDITIKQIKRCNSLKFKRPNIIESIDTDLGLIKGDLFVDATGKNAFLSKKINSKRVNLSQKLICKYGQFEQPAKNASNYSKFTWTHSGWIWTSQINDNLRSWVSLDINGNFDTLDKKYQNSILGSRNCTWQYNTEVYKGNSFAIGDAAFNFDPSSSNGILKSFMTSIKLISLLVQCNSNQAGKTYQDWIKNWVTNDFKNVLEGYTNNNIELQTFTTKLEK